MGRDPLSFFLNEKVAANLAPDTALDGFEQKPFSKDPDPQSLDPGERALAGMTAVSGSVIGGAATWITNMYLTSAAVGDATQVTKFQQAQDFGPRERRPRGRLLGLFDVESRIPSIPAAANKQWAETNKAIFESDKLRAAGDHAGARKIDSRLKKLNIHPVNRSIATAEAGIHNMHRVVESFMSEKKLREKGVTINFKQGPLNWALGPRYETATKRVYLPLADKAIAMHELGHAADYTAGRIGKIRKILEPMLMRGAQFALPVALVAGDRIAEILPGTIDDKIIRFLQDNAPAIMGATIAATTLYPEAKASVLAVNHIAKVEGPKAARAAMRKLGPAFGTYLLGAIPAVVGMAFARKYMREARAEKTELVDKEMLELEKEGGFIPSIAEIVGMVQGGSRFVRSTGRDLAFIGKQVGQQAVQIINEPGTMRKITQAAKEIGRSPEFIQGALAAAIPAASGALYLYGTSSGREIRKRMTPEHSEDIYSHSKKGVPLARHTEERWREENPKLFAGLVAMGAAMSGGVIAKFISDLSRVL